MKSVREIRAGLIGNPNCGKTSLFNSLTGLNQHVGNFPGITVDKKTGIVKLPHNTFIEIIDFPGCYSLYPNSSDEKLVVDILSNPDNRDFPDFIIYVVDATDMDRQFLLATQIRDLGIPLIMVITMKDIADERDMHFNLTKIEKEFGFPVVFFSNKTKENLKLIKEYLSAFRAALLPANAGLKTAKKSILTGFKKEENKQDQFSPDMHHGFVPKYLETVIKLLTNSNQLYYYNLSRSEKEIVSVLKAELNAKTDYQALIQIHHASWLSHISKSTRSRIEDKKQSLQFNSIGNQIDETLSRYHRFTPVIKDAVKQSKPQEKSITDKIDRVITHKIFGPVIFFILMLLIFQAIFSWAAYPMNLIELAFQQLGSWTKLLMAPGWFTDLLVEGVIAGVGGVMVFIPQIFFLFLMIGMMEEIGYMSRVVYMFDRLMQRFGLNGRSLVSLISAGACAIPAIMSTRTIGERKERLITILITPLISCSARIPVYTLLISFAVPDISYGIFNARGLAFMGLYLLGILVALAGAVVMKMLLKTGGRSFLMLSLPEYKQPLIKNIVYFVKEKVGAFIFEAGKIILMISIILWGLASYGPADKMALAESQAIETASQNDWPEERINNLIASKKIEASYAGQLGKWIEPAIKPLGFDWKIGIALITSFAAREVFVGTMATIYSIGSATNDVSIKNRMATEINYETGEKVYSVATSWSLLIFYVFALQCMSTLAVTRRETGSWKWPLLQFSYMGILAYSSSYLVFNLLS